MAQLMKIDSGLKWMDSLMVAFNIKQMGRLELLYTCVANLAKELAKTQEFPEQLMHYTEVDDRNRVIYHNYSDETSVKIGTVLKDAALLQNPADPDATYREKVGKQHCGYVTNVVEVCGEGGNLVEAYRYEQNIHSDSQFVKETLEVMDKQDKTVTIVTDGVYVGTQNEELAAGKNARIVTTNLTGRETKDIKVDFEFSVDGRKFIRCSGRYEPKSCSYNWEIGRCTVSLQRNQCQGLPV